MAKVGKLAGASTASPFESPVVSWHPNEQGMSWEMDYNTRRTPVPNVPPPVSRSSLAQQILIHRYQQSKYISVLRYFGLRPDYPAFHGFKIINGAPQVSNTGIPSLNSTNLNQFYKGVGTEGIAPFPRAKTAGTMRPVSRFVKALPVPIPSYNAPTYSVQE